MAELPDINRGKVVGQSAALQKKVRHQNHNGPWKKTHRGCRGGKNRQKPFMKLSQPRLRATHWKQARPSTTTRKEARPTAARRRTSTKNQVCIELTRNEKARPNAASRQNKRDPFYRRQQIMRKVGQRDYQ